MENLIQAATSPPVEGVLERLLDEAEAAAPQPPPASVPPPPSTFPAPAASSSVSAVSPSADAPPQAGNGNPLASLLANPAVLSALPALMENLTPLFSGMGHGVGGAPAATRPHSIDRHTALLCAIKPYLSPHRRDTAETVIRLCRVWDALERSGISLTGLLGAMGSGGASSSERRDGDVQ